MRQLIVAIAIGLIAASSGSALAQESAPRIAIGGVTQNWNKVRVDYSVSDPARMQLRVVRPSGRTIVVDRAIALTGTLVWDRKIRFHHVPAGTYRLEVVATNAGGTTRTLLRMRLKLAYLLGPAQVTGGKAILRYALAARARVRLYAKRPGHAAVLVERRLGHRGRNRITWDFLINGRPAPAGRYVLLLKASTR